MYVDVYRPDTDVPAAPLVSWSPYGKHNPAPDRRDLPEQRGPAGVHRRPDHVRGARPGVLGPARLRHRPRRRARAPGTREGRATYRSPQEARAFADLVEWAGTQPWSAGKVGLSGVSYLTVSAVARRRAEPAAPRRDQPVGGVERHLPGGRPARRHPGDLVLALHLGALGRQHHRDRGPRGRDGGAPVVRRVLGESKAAASRRSRCRRSWWPAGRTRGCTPAARSRASGASSSAQKWLDVHGRKKWAYYYEPENIERQRAFFDHFLLGKDTGLESWPRVRAEVRERLRRGHLAHRPGVAARGRRVPPAPPAGRRRLARAGSRSTPRSACVYDGLGSGLAPAPGHVRDRASPSRWSWSATSRPRCTCPPTDGDDLDVFVALFKLDADGRQVGFPYYAQFEDGPVAVGWLRASHRELDPERSTDYLPVLAHRRALPLTPASRPGWTSRSGRRAPASRRGSSCCWSSRAAT